MNQSFNFLIVSFSEDTFDIFVYVWILIAVMLFPVLLKITPPYGRYSNPSWGPVVNNRVSWFFMEIPSFAIIVWFFMKAPDYQNKLAMTGFILWLIHYFNRSFIFPLRLRTKSKKMPLTILLSGAFFNIINAGLNGYWLAYLAPDVQPLSSVHFIVGIILFVTGFIINQYHDNILINLRRFSSGYKIPGGGLFKYISCPNYFGEIVQWTGFAVLCWSLPALSFAVWTIVNLVPRALRHQKWYHEKFKSYPASRKAIIPFVL